MSEKYVSFEYKKNPVSIGVVSRNGWKQVVGTAVKIESIEIVYIPIDQNTVVVTDTVTGLIHKTIKISYKINSAKEMERATVPYSAMFAAELDRAGISKVKAKWGSELKDLEKKYGSKPLTIWLTKEMFELVKKNYEEY